MAFLNFLGQLGGAMNGGAEPVDLLAALANGGEPAPGFGGGYDPVTGKMSFGGSPGRDERMAQLTAGLPAQAPRPKPKGSGIANVLGIIGDVIAMSQGRPAINIPLIQQRKQQERLAPIMQNYLADPQGTISALLGSGEVELGLQLMKMGQGPDTPAAVREFQEYQKLPPQQQRAYENYLRLKNPAWNNPITMGQNDTFEGAPAASGGGNLPRVNTPDEAMRLPPGTQFLLPDGRVGTVPGGPTALPSGVFP